MSKLFTDLTLDERVMAGIRDLNFTEMTPIQEQALPLVLAGHDLIGAAQTGTGKTAVFLIPLLQRLVGRERGVTRALILVPTRELALQIDQQMTGIAYHCDLTSAVVVGGLDFADQEYAIRGKSDVIIATPGRLIDHLRFDHVDFSNIEYVVFDEADRMLDMGFYQDVKKIMESVPKKRQTLLFSATINADMKKMSAEFMVKPRAVTVGRQAPVNAVVQRFIDVDENQKEATLLHLLRHQKMDSVLIFAKTKRGVAQLARRLQHAGISCEGFHGDIPQEERIEILDQFRRGDVVALVATDVASRGLDIDDVTHVINYDIPFGSDDYIHRVGRTARAKKTGEAITFCTPDDDPVLDDIEDTLGRGIVFEHIRLAPHRPQKFHRR